MHSGRGHPSTRHLRPSTRRWRPWRPTCSKAAEFWPRSAVDQRASSWWCQTQPALRHSPGSQYIPTCSGMALRRRWSPRPRSLQRSVAIECVELLVRAEFPDFVAFWQHRGFVVDRQVPHGVILTKRLPLAIKVPTSDAMVRLGERLAQLLRPGDVILAAGDLGAGKTTLTQGIGRGLGSEGPIISPTFVLSRIHPSASWSSDSDARGRLPALRRIGA